MLLGLLTLCWHLWLLFCTSLPGRAFHRVLSRDLAPGAGQSTQWPAQCSVLSLCVDPAQDTRWLLPGGGQTWVFFDLAFTFGFQTLPVHCLGLKPGRNFQNQESYLIETVVTSLV